MPSGGDGEGRRVGDAVIGRTRLVGRVAPVEATMGSTRPPKSLPPCPTT